MNRNRANYILHRIRILILIRRINHWYSTRTRYKWKKKKIVVVAQSKNMDNGNAEGSFSFTERQ